MSTLIQNAAYCIEDDVYIISTHRHDYVTHVFRDGLKLSLDGGAGPDGYTRRVGDLYKLLDPVARYEERCLLDSEPFEHIAEHLLWGTRGKAGDEPLSYRPIKELAYRAEGIEHLRAILRNCPAIGPFHKRVVEHWLAVREAEIQQA